MNAKKIISISTGIALVTSMALAIPAFAETNGSGNNRMAITINQVITANPKAFGTVL